MEKCPMCRNSTLKKRTEDEEMFGVHLGKFVKLVCDDCGESFTDEIVTQAIIKRAKEKGIWGLGKKLKIMKTGNSLAIRIPKPIVDFLNLKQNREIFIRPENKSKLVIEI